MKMFSGIVHSLISAPIWFYLQYKILLMVSASELMWFLFWVYVPVCFITSVLFRLSEDES